MRLRVRAQFYTWQASFIYFMFLTYFPLKLTKQLEDRGSQTDVQLLLLNLWISSGDLKYPGLVCSVLRLKPKPKRGRMSLGERLWEGSTSPIPSRSMLLHPEPGRVCVPWCPLSSPRAQSTEERVSWLEPRSQKGGPGPWTLQPGTFPKREAANPSCIHNMMEKSNMCPKYELANINYQLMLEKT